MTQRCEIHQPSFRHHLLRQFEVDDACLRFFLRRNTLYLFYPTLLMLGEIAQKVHDAFLDSFVAPVFTARNLLSEPPGELLCELARVLLHRIEYIEYNGKVEHSPETENETRGETTHEYRVNLRTIDDMFRRVRLDFDTRKAIQLLKDEEGISEMLLIEKYNAMHVISISHERARAALKELDRLNLTKCNGNLRKWGHDVLKIS